MYRPSDESVQTEDYRHPILQTEASLNAGWVNDAPLLVPVVGRASIQLHLVALRRVLVEAETLVLFV